MGPDELLRSVRRRHALTQTDLARRAGTSQPVISAYERGRRDPTYRTLERLIEAAGERLRLGADVGEGGPPPPRDVAEHAHRLVDVLLLADAVPTRRPRSRTLQAPRLVSVAPT